ncbi:helix-turn-helix domain-containing protein [uncultured Sphingomonas sp.]|uniref:helix-turn-helix domain-containing protein n=1 Tax=uncultured Sphingomonas sp. TaxID=158754 RepID=UPI00338FA899
MFPCRQLTFTERCSIAALQEARLSSRRIAVPLDREPSAVSREWQCDGVKRIDYHPTYDQAHARPRRRHGCRPSGRPLILTRPGQVAARDDAGHREARAILAIHTPRIGLSPSNSRAMPASAPGRAR